MAEPGNRSLRDFVERLALASIGAVALTAERADALADDLARRGGIKREEAREAIEEARVRWRNEAGRMSERAGVTLQGFFNDIGLATRDEVSDLELRLAQLEHRLRLLESAESLPTFGGE
jgi:polyhydroxyalkanoate synthesis regulator phasin